MSIPFNGGQMKFLSRHFVTTAWPVVLFLAAIFLTAGCSVPMRGYGLINAGDYNGALILLQAHVDAHPEDAYAWQLLGEANMRLGRAGRGVAALETSVSLRPYDPASRVLLALAYLKARDLAPAVQVLADFSAPHYPDQEENVRQVGKKLETLFFETGGNLPEKGTLLEDPVQDLEKALTALRAPDSSRIPGAAGSEGEGCGCSI